MKKLITFLTTICISWNCFAGHIAGGEMFYKYLGPGISPNTDKYVITLRLFRECHPIGTAAQLPEDVLIGIYRDASPSSLLLSRPVPRTSFTTISLQQALVCITNPPEICYQVAEYSFTEELKQDSIGYILAYQTCCRSNSIMNVQFFEIPGGQGPGEGATYVCSIPGLKSLPEGHNSSAVFNIKDTVLVCKSKNIDLDFSASDPDGDSLTYEFCAAFDRGASTDSRNIVPSNPPYHSVTYRSNYSGSQPMGTDISIDKTTGIISGTAPFTGAYVINVCIIEWRKGVIVSTHRKDFMVRVADCDFAAAELKPSYITCDGFTLTFMNESSSSSINSYYWEFGDSHSDVDSSTDPTPSYTYSDSGTYPIKLVVNKGEQCSDSTTSKALVYPGFIPNFKVSGSCSINPYQFTDLTTSKYGVVDTWQWDFGNVDTNGDTSLLQNPTYTYPDPDSVDVRLIVTNSKGCIDTLIKPVMISDKPTISLPFRDTLICIIDTLQLQAASGTPAATFTWSPTTNNIINYNSANPLVYPQKTTTYIVTVNDRGCITTDSVTVNVVPGVQLFAGPDTTICKTDTLQLKPVSNALYFKWSPSLQLSDANTQAPFATPLVSTQYTVTASIGKCSASDAVNINVVPYPTANAGTDASICFGKTVVLKAVIVGANFAWYPVNSLLNENTLTPIAGPQATTDYVLTVSDVNGCPKPVSDTVVVNVIPRVAAFAGHDTSIVANQPLQLNATGGTIYTWSPATGMDNPNISNPVITLGSQYDSILYKVRVGTPEGCSASDDIKVTVFRTQPDIFIPTAFTPNNDKLNDVLKPKPVGLKQFNYFRIFNRWGVMVFNTTQQDKGWDGTYSGSQQSSGTYVFIAQGIDYNGKLITKKGTVVLIR